MKVDREGDTYVFISGLSMFLSQIHLLRNIYGLHAKKWSKVGRIIVASTVGN